MNCGAGYGVFVWGLICVLAGFMSACAATKATVIPAVFEAGHVYATPGLTDGRRMRLLADMGGGGGEGLILLPDTAARRLGLPFVRCAGPGFSLMVVKTLPFQPGAGLPSAQGPRVCPAEAKTIDATAVGNTMDGIAGAGYLSHFIWTLDYPAQRLRAEADDWRPDARMSRIPLMFAHDTQSERVNDFPGVVVTIDGEALPLLFDTGATAFPTAAGLAA